MRKIALSLMLAITVLLGVASLCPAEGEPKPLVTVSFAGYDRLVADIDMIGQLGGNPTLGKQFEMLALMLQFVLQPDLIPSTVLQRIMLRSSG